MIVELNSDNRWDAIDELIDHLVSAGRLETEHRKLIVDAVKKRETSMSTGIGFGIAIPHASTSHVSEVVGIHGRSKTGIDFNSLDRKPVHIVCLFLVPAGDFQKHINVLANLAKFLHRAEVREGLTSASSDAEVSRLFNEYGFSQSACIPNRMASRRCTLIQCSAKARHSARNSSMGTESLAIFLV